MKKGDKVAHKDQDLEGIITEINGNEISFITTDGFEYKFPKNKLVVIDKQLENELLLKNIQPKDFKENKKKQRFYKTKVPEYDLHIEKIMPGHSHLSASQKLEIQLKEARDILLKMKNSHHKELIFIHGHGKQVLKKELIKLIKKSGSDYYDASYQKYGGGAIRVILRP